MKQSLRVIISIATAMFALHMSGDEHCIETDTVMQCVHRFLGADTTPTAETAAKGAEAGQKAVSAATTGVTSLISASQSAKKDFISTLLAALEMPTGSDDSKPLSFDYNFPIRLLDAEQRLKLQAVLQKPDLSSELSKRLAADDVKALKDNLSYSDDVTISASLNPSTKRLGRSITPHRALFESMLAPRLQGDPKADQLAGEFFVRANIASNNGSMDKTFVDLMPGNGATEKEQRKKAIDDLEASARASALTEAISLAKLFSVLLNNQPQLYGSAVYRTRKDVAGPNERSAKLTYEMGRHNLNDLYATGKCDGGSDECFANLKTVAAAAATDSATSTGRLALSIEYAKTDPVTITIPKNSIDFTTTDGHKFVYSAVYGFASNMMSKSGRLDVSISYEDTTVAKTSDNVALGRPVRRSLAEPTTATLPPPRDRFVGSVTYTVKLSEKMELPLSIVYANHTQFLGDVTKKLNAHFGLVYKLPSGK